jgi:hypothetical protein
MAGAGGQSGRDIFESQIGFEWRQAVTQTLEFPTNLLVCFYFTLYGVGFLVGQGAEQKVD